MKDILQAPFLTELVATASNMYRLGWDERNSGNLSLRLSGEEVAPYVDTGCAVREFPLNFAAPALAGEYYLVTAAGSYFKNLERTAARDLGLIQIGAEGTTARLLWGYEGGNRPTSELPAHLMTHLARRAVDPESRVVTHCHPTNLMAMTYVHDLEERAFTRTLWRMCTECIMVFPEGVSVLPWMVCGTPEIGAATAEKMADTRLVVWAHHGIYAAGRTLDEAFGLMETAEKAAEIYLKIAHLPIKQTITDRQLRDMANHVGATPREGWLED